MAALTAAEVRITWRAMLDKDGGFSTAFSKADLQAAVSAMDTWLTNNQAAGVATLPDPFKTNSTPAQKNLMLAYVALKRAGVI